MFFIESKSLMSFFSSRILFRFFDKLSILPSTKLSITVTSEPASSSESTKCEGIKPAPPVTITFFLL